MANSDSIQTQDVPALTWRDVLTLNEGSTLSDTEQTSLNEYFGQFADPKRNDKGETLCVGCSLPFYNDGLMSALLGASPGRTSYEWGIAHGICKCIKCGWPARAYHYDIGKDDAGQPIIKRMNVTLPFHPSVVRRNDESQHGGAGQGEST
jgi:hypothetical protein